MYHRLPSGPMRTPSQIATEGRELWWDNLAALVWITVLFASPFAIATVVLTLGMGDVVEVDGRIDVLFDTTNVRDLHRMLTGTLAIANVLAGLVAWGAVVAYLSRRQGPEPTDWQQAMKLAFEKLGALLRVAMIEFLIIVAIAILLIAIFDVGVPALVVAVVTAAAIFIRVWPTQVIVMLEEEPAFDALRRSWDLVAGRGWVVLYALTLTALRLIGYGLGLALATLFLTLMIENLMGPTATLIWTAATQLAFSALLSPLLAAVALPLYVDLRRRQEGDESSP